MTKAIHNYVIMTVDKDGKEKRVNANGKDVAQLVLDTPIVSDGDAMEFFMRLLIEGQSKLEDHVNGLDHVVWSTK